MTENTNNSENHSRISHIPPKQENVLHSKNVDSHANHRPSYHMDAYSKPAVEPITSFQGRKLVDITGSDAEFSERVRPKLSKEHHASERVYPIRECTIKAVGIEGHRGL